MKLLTIHYIILAVAMVGFGVFDSTLSLGKLQGVVFILWTLYFCIGLFIVDTIIAIVYAVKKNKKSKKFFYSGVLVGGTGAVIALILSSFL